MQEYITLAHQLADASGTIIKQYFRALVSLQEKDDHSPVTVADLEAEEAMRRLIQASFPEHGIIGEEADAENGDAEYVWVLDPIDGTANFITGQPLFGTLIALLQNGEPILGMINQPINNERWLATRDDKTTLNGERTCVRTYSDIGEAVLSTTSPYLFSPEKKAAFEALMSKCRYTVFGSDCYAYAMLATGHLDLVVESGLKAHDVMALIPVVEGANGIVTDWHGNRITLGTGEIDIIAATDKTLHQQALAVLNSHA